MKQLNRPDTDTDTTRNRSRILTKLGATGAVAIGLAGMLAFTHAGPAGSASPHADQPSATVPAPAVPAAPATTTTTVPATTSTTVKAKPATFVSMDLPEGGTIGKTLTVSVECSRAITAADQAWIVFRNVTTNSNLFHTSPGMFRYTPSGFTVVLPLPVNLRPGVYDAEAGCAGPRELVGSSLPREVAGPITKFYIRPDKAYSEFVSVTPSEATVGATVTFTVTCSLPPGNATLLVGEPNGVILVKATDPKDFVVKGSTFTVTAEIPENTPIRDYKMRAACDGPSPDATDYFPPPSSSSDILTFKVLKKPADVVLPSLL